MKLGLKVGAAFVTVALGSTAVHGPTPALAFVGAGAILAAPLPIPCTGYCFVCQLDPGHVAGIPDICEGENCQFTHYEGPGWHTTECLGATSCWTHENGCEPPGEEMDTGTAAEVAAVASRDLFAQVSGAVAREDGEALQQLLVANPRRLHYEADRGAVQIIAVCDGEVIAHYPVSSSVAASFD